MPKVFIIILHWNNDKDTLECLESLQKIDYPDYQVVVVDNGSIEKFSILNSQFSIKIIYNQENLGFAGGNNAGIRYALEQNADYVLLLNNDTIVDKDFLKRLVEAGENDERFGILGPKIYFYDRKNNVILREPKATEESRGQATGPGVYPEPFVSLEDRLREGPAQGDNVFWSAGGKINWLYNKGTMRGYGETDRGQYDGPLIQKTDFITGCCLLIKRQAIEKIGLMPEDYFLYYEDTDWSLKARQAGFKCIFVPAAKIWHKGSKSSQESSPSYIYYHIRNGLIFSRRFAPFYLRPLIHLDAFWRILKQIVKLIFFPGKRVWAKYILLGIRDFYLGKRGKYDYRY